MGAGRQDPAPESRERTRLNESPRPPVPCAQDSRRGDCEGIPVAAGPADWAMSRTSRAQRTARQGPNSRPVTARHERPSMRRQNHRCMHCGDRTSHGRMEIDHIMPVSRDGSNDESDLQALCQECNMRKGAQAEEEFRHGPRSHAQRIHTDQSPHNKEDDPETSI